MTTTDVSDFFVADDKSFISAISQNLWPDRLLLACSTYQGLAVDPFTTKEGLHPPWEMHAVKPIGEGAILLIIGIQEDHRVGTVMLVTRVSAEANGVAIPTDKYSPAILRHMLKLPPTHPIDSCMWLSRCATLLPARVCGIAPDFTIDCSDSYSVISVLTDAFNALATRIDAPRPPLPRYLPQSIFFWSSLFTFMPGEDVRALSGASIILRDIVYTASVPLRTAVEAATGLVVPVKVAQNAKPPEEVLFRLNQLDFSLLCIDEDIGAVAPSPSPATRQLDLHLPQGRG